MKQSLFGVRAFSCNRSEPDVANLILERCISFNNKSLCLSKKPPPICTREDDYQNICNYRRKPSNSLSLAFGNNKTISPSKYNHINYKRKKGIVYLRDIIQDVRSTDKITTAGHQLQAKIPEGSSPIGKSNMSKLLNASIEPLLAKPSTATRHTKYFNVFFTKKNRSKINSSFLFIDCHHLRDSLPTKDRYNLHAPSPVENKFAKFKQLISKCDSQLNSADFKVLQRKQHNNSCLFQEKSYYEEIPKNEISCLPSIGVGDAVSKRKIILMKVKKNIA